MSRKPETEKQDGLLELERPRPTSLPPLPAHPLVSVVVPSRNDAAFLEQTIHSVLQQDYEPIELIIVDGASTDGTLDILREYEGEPRVRWISEPDNGPFQAWNRGLKLASGDLIAIQTANDTYLPGAIREMVEEFVAEPGLAFVGGWTREIDVDGVPTGKTTMLRDERFDYSVDDIVGSLGGYPRGQATAFRRDLLLAIGGFDENAPNHGTIILHYMLEAARLGACSRAVPRVWASYRIHPGQRHTTSTQPSVAFFQYSKLACLQNAKRYKDFLTRRQLRMLRRSGYYAELRYRTQVLRQIGPAIPAALGYFWFGGGPHMLKYLLKALRSLSQRLLGHFKLTGGLI